MEDQAEMYKSKAGVAAAAALTKLTPELLLLGLRLLAKNGAAGKTPCAAVQPRPHDLPPQQQANNPGSPDSACSPLKRHSGSPPSSPEQNQQVPLYSGRKRKRGESEELTDDQKREKRCVFIRLRAPVNHTLLLWRQKNDEQDSSSKRQRP
jgi:hypothetical protein